MLRKNNSLVWSILIFLMVFVSGCAVHNRINDTEQEEVTGRKMYLATNLHADRGLGTLNSVNYQVIGTLIPWGTRVNISEEVRWIVFRKAN